jgi:hypothetical protein
MTRKYSDYLFAGFFLGRFRQVMQSIFVAMIVPLLSLANFYHPAIRRQLRQAR